MREATHRPNRPKLYLIKNQRGFPPPHLSAGDRVILFDGECVLRRRLIRFLMRIDRRQPLRLATVQSPPGQDLLRWVSLPTDDFNTIAYISQGQVSVPSAAFLQALTQLGWPWWALAIMQLFPRGRRDKLPAGTLPPEDGRGTRYLDHS